MNEANHQALIIGAGAIGIAISGLLQACGFQVSFVGRRGPVAVRARLLPAPVNASHGARQGGSPAEFYPGVAAAAVIDTASVELRSLQPALIVVAVKAFDLAAALAWTQQLAGQGRSVPAVVWPLSNGAVQPLVAAAAAKRPDLVWRLGYCTFGVSAEDGVDGAAADGADVSAAEAAVRRAGVDKEKPNRVYSWRSRTGELAFGPLPWAGGISGAQKEPTAVEAALLAQAPLCRWQARIGAWHQRKWLVNTVLNTLAAARRCRSNGEVLGDLPMLAAVFAEAYQLGESLWGPWPFTRSELYRGVLQIAEATAANENSMARDKRLGRPTESDFLAGLAPGPEQYPLLWSLHRQVTGAAC